MLIGYLRNSKHDKNPRLQLGALLSAGCERIFKETSEQDLSELKALLTSLNPGDTLVVWELNRLAHSIPELLETIQQLAQKRIGLQVITPKLDTTKKGGQIIYAVFSAASGLDPTQLYYPCPPFISERYYTTPKKLSKKEVDQAKQDNQKLYEIHTLMADPEHTPHAICWQLGISCSMIYCYLDRTLLQRIIDERLEKMCASKDTCIAQRTEKDEEKLRQYMAFSEKNKKALEEQKKRLYRSWREAHKLLLHSHQSFIRVSHKLGINLGLLYRSFTRSER